MENLLGLLRIKVKRGINLSIRDTSRRTSDPYVVVILGQQNLKTRVIKGSCNPEWNDDLTLCITDPKQSPKLIVHDKDTLTVDDKMGEAEIEVEPFLHFCMQAQRHEISPNENEVLWKAQPSDKNFLAQESCIVWKKEKIVQDMCLRLTGVESGEVEIQLQFVKLPGQ